eukprot:TRINITY_DN2051_c0_g1_i1.p1 TRINITY_DN2051_c0_g1~~TRINITY_DN2051_c0_g1_i1.p1  ORF type:complete len:253 (+),score=75.79 TRINITY_DN2051_c0_g1_i1:25-759(+)
MIRRPPRSTHCISSAASDVYKRQEEKKEEQEKIKLLIKMVSPIEEFELEFPLDEPIEKVKDAIRLRHSEYVAKDRLKLFYKGNELADDVTLKNMFKGKLIPLEVILILLVLKEPKRNDEDPINPFPVFLHVFKHKHRLKIQPSETKHCIPTLTHSNNEDPNAWMKRMPLRDEHYNKLLKEYVVENELVDEEELLRLKVLNEFPGYWHMFNWYSIFWIYQIVGYFAGVSEGLRFVVFLSFCLAYY